MRSGIVYSHFGCFLVSMPNIQLSSLSQCLHWNAILFPKLLRFGNLNLNIWSSASFNHFLGLPKMLTESRPCRCQYIMTVVCYNLSVIKKRGCLTHCRPMLFFCTPKIDQKTRGFLKFFQGLQKRNTDLK